MALNIIINKVSVAASFAAGATVATAVASGGTAPYVYSLATGGDKFAINSSTGVVTTIAAMDITNIASFSITATDSTTGTALTGTSDVTYPPIQAAIRSKFDRTNVMYKITKDIDLGHGVLTIPEGCTLDFQGGSFTNGTLVGNQTKIKTSDYNIFNNCTLRGFSIKYYSPIWFGAKADFDESTHTGTDDSASIKRAIEACNSNCGSAVEIVGRYYISSTIEVTEDLNIIGYFNNYRDFETTYYTNSVSVIGVAPNCIAFDIKGRGTSFKVSNIHLSHLLLLGKDKNSVFIKYNCSGAPSRVGYFSDIETRGFDKVLYFYNDGTSNTQYGNLTIERVVASNNEQFIVAKSANERTKGTLINLVIRDSNIEHNSGISIELDGLEGPNIIDNCILEGNPSPTIKARIINGALQITNNYFEENYGDIISITGNTYETCFTSITNNTVLSSKSDPINYRISACTINEISLIERVNLILSLVIINPPVLGLAKSITGNYIFFKEKRYIDTVNLNSAQSKLVLLNNQWVDHWVKGGSITTSLNPVTTIYSSVNVGDVILLSFYARERGSVLAGLYTSTGSGISSASNIPIINGINILKFTVNTNVSTSFQVRMSSNKGKAIIGNGTVYVNPTESDYQKLNIGIWQEIE